MADKFLKNIQDIVLSTEGVAELSFPGVRSVRKDKSYELEIYINTEYGFVIPEIAWNIQERILKYSKENNNDTYTRINIHAENIKFKQKERQ